MKNLKFFLLALFTLAFVLFVSWALSLVGKFYWLGIICFVVIVFIAQMILLAINPKLIARATPGLIVSGVIYAYIASGLTGEYEAIFQFLGLIILAFTWFIICIPNLVKRKK